ncbi:IS481 family transposase [Mycobacterium sp. 852002-51057_SCH5723018]|uniref:IS481 family transposase n=1 Tax=Mycobacterium sp. 852002-51057_SCH5723018 TaxID=1834094 RepID=UPI0007FCDD9E|nr:IS481 family transposase [Mycobacterium sp. 852002-51057_SCH5723018]OBG27505.1 transposase [Mycobacterium sp. 852002-51057_SCH5723018]
MSKARVVVLEVTSGRLSVAAAARAYGLSRQHIYRLLKRYHQDGLEAVDPRSRRPASNPRAVSNEVIATVVLLRKQLVDDGLDAGPVTLQAHLAQKGLPVPSTSTIRRVLGHHGLITPQPRKRPKSSYHRFQAEQPNQCWQSDFTHWTLADGTDVEILNWLDDHSRYLLACIAYRRVGGADVVATFTVTASRFGLPKATLTDHGSVYTSRFTHGHNDFERLLASLGITQKNGHPGHPQTQGKIERFHQTLKRWLAARPRPATIAELQNLLDTFQTIYNTARTHRAHPGRLTPEQAYLARPKASPTGQPNPQFRIRHDTIDRFGKLTLRHGSRLHHLRIGCTHAHTPVLILVTTHTVTVISKTGHHVLSSHHIDPDKNYWRNQNKNPGRWPGNL